MATWKSKHIKINGHEMPPIASLDVLSETIWSKDTGRDAQGLMQGDVVAKKLKLEMKFAPMTLNQYIEFKEHMYSSKQYPFFEVWVSSDICGDRTARTFIMYAGEMTAPVYSLVRGLPRYVGGAINFIER